MHPGTTAAGPRPAPADRRGAVLSLLRSLASALAITAAYFVFPLDHLRGYSWLELGAGLALVGAVLAWYLRDITQSAHPRVRGLEAVAVTAVLFLTLFAITYYVMGQAAPTDFNEPLTKLDSLYFTVTVFATVGFGDIVPVSSAARGVATLQMVSDLVLVGVVAKVLLNAVQLGVRSAVRSADQPADRPADQPVDRS